MTKQDDTKWLQGKSILIIEDDVFISKIYTKWFTLAGAHVRTAHNGALGLRMLREETVHLILLDLGMPGLNGYETLTFIRGDDATKHIPVIVLSNTTLSPKSKEYRDIKEAGVTHILRKYETSLNEILTYMKEYFVRDTVKS